MTVELSQERKERLLLRAQQARENAYVPYSHYRVGACLLCEDGTEYTGCNVENAAYGSTICAERTALLKAISEGARRFAAIAVVGSGESIAYPCGACRQVLQEFNREMVVLSANSDLSKVHAMRLADLLPCGFGPADLGERE